MVWRRCISAPSLTFICIATPYEAVEAISDFACNLGINIPTGKDSLSMVQKYKEGAVYAAEKTKENAVYAKEAVCYLYQFV